MDDDLICAEFNYWLEDGNFLTVMQADLSDHPIEISFYSDYLLLSTLFVNDPVKNSQEAISPTILSDPLSLIGFI